MAARHWLGLTFVLLALAGASRARAGEPGEVEQEPAYEVQRGDTLGAIARAVGKTIDELVVLNPGLSPDRVRAGQRLRTGDAGRRVEHVVASGETLSRIAAQYGVAVRDVLGWNPGAEADRIRAGQRLAIHTRVPDSRSESIGSPTHGKLLFAAQLPPHRGYVLRNPERAWATRETVDAIVAAFKALREADPKAPKVRVHDLSLRHGGPIDDHQSHQSGRDVDITYFQKNATKECPLRPIKPHELDVERQWALLQHWLDRGQLEAAFIDYDLQAKLYAHARAQGASREQLMHWFQYPRGRTAALGIVRHAPKHADHVHLRFVCDATDAACQMFRVMPIHGSVAAR